MVEPSDMTTNNSSTSGSGVVDRGNDNATPSLRRSNSVDNDNSNNDGGIDKNKGNLCLSDNQIIVWKRIKEGKVKDYKSIKDASTLLEDAFKQSGDVVDKIPKNEKEFDAFLSNHIYRACSISEETNKRRASFSILDTTFRLLKKRRKLLDSSNLQSNVIDFTVPIASNPFSSSTNETLQPDTTDRTTPTPATAAAALQPPQNNTSDNRDNNTMDGQTQPRNNTTLTHPQRQLHPEAAPRAHLIPTASTGAVSNSSDRREANQPRNYVSNDTSQKNNFSSPGQLEATPPPPPYARRSSHVAVVQRQASRGEGTVASGQQRGYAVAPFGVPQRRNSHPNQTMASVVATPIHSGQAQDLTRNNNILTTRPHSPKNKASQIQPSHMQRNLSAHTHSHPQQATQLPTSNCGTGHGPVPQNAPLRSQSLSSRALPGQSDMRKTTAPPAHITNKVLEVPTMDMRDTEHYFNEDKEKFAESLDARPTTRIVFTRQYPSADMASSVSTRLATWEPFSHTKSVIDVGMTSPAKKVEWRATNHPQYDFTVAKFDMKLKADQIKSVNTWGQKVEPRDGGFRILLRMLPVRLPKKQKKADCHLWPKGTYLTINGQPIRLRQRKQQNHDHTLWKNICYHLDVTQYIKNPNKKHEFALLCRDTDLFYYCLSICHFRPVSSIRDTLLSSVLRKLTLEESTEKAMKLVQQQMIVLGDDEEGKQTEAGQFIFSLTCPISMVAMRVPVRGIDCKHWQCCDLENYLASNVNPSGNRWRCTSCESFIPIHRLEVCGLTSEALSRFQSEISMQRNRVEFRSDKTYHLLGPTRKRYQNRKNNQTGNGDSKPAVPPTAEVMIID